MGIKKPALKPRIYILCNGELAEPQYFQDFKNHLRSHNIIVRYKKEFRKKAPWDFIEAAITFKKEEQSDGKFSPEDNDQMWCVLDVDNYWSDNEQKFRNAISRAKKEAMKIAWSNECFEFWFLCHFAHYNSAIPRSDYHKKLGKHFKDKKLGTYTKNMKGIFNVLEPWQQTALQNAAKLFKAEAIQQNPSTAIHLLAGELLSHFGS